MILVLVLFLFLSSSLALYHTYILVNLFDRTFVSGEGEGFERSSIQPGSFRFINELSNRSQVMEVLQPTIKSVVPKEQKRNQTCMTIRKWRCLSLPRPVMLSLKVNSV